MRAWARCHDYSSALGVGKQRPTTRKWAMARCGCGREHSVVTSGPGGGSRLGGPLTSPASLKWPSDCHVQPGPRTTCSQPAEAQGGGDAGAAGRPACWAHVSEREPTQAPAGLSVLLLGRVALLGRAGFTAQTQPSPPGSPGTIAGLQGGGSHLVRAKAGRGYSEG